MIFTKEAEISVRLYCPAYVEKIKIIRQYTPECADKEELQNYE